MNLLVKVIANRNTLLLWCDQCIQKEIELFKFQLITDPEGVPQGTDLFNKTNGPKKPA